jgi:hypothetical protein
LCSWFAHRKPSLFGAPHFERHISNVVEAPNVVKALTTPGTL